MASAVGWGVDVVVGVVFLVFCEQSGTWCAVCRVGATDMHHPCFPVATYSMCMGMGDWGWRNACDTLGMVVTACV